MTAAPKDQKQTTITLTAMCHCSQAHLLHIWWEKDTDKTGLIPDNQPDVALQIATSPGFFKKEFKKNSFERRTMTKERKRE